jgi:hypothetical protein
VARTLAERDGAERASRMHLTGTLSYRPLAGKVRRAA